MSTLDRLKKIAAKGERWPAGAEVEVLIALPKLLTVVEAAQYSVQYDGHYNIETAEYVTGRDVLRKALAALDHAEQDAKRSKGKKNADKHSPTTPPAE